MAGRFVRASGCSAPTAKDPAAALAELGRMKVRWFDGSDGRREAQVMLRHPNYSGLRGVFPSALTNLAPS